MALTRARAGSVCSAALNSLKRAKKVEYEGMMLLLPVNADVVISRAGAAPAGGGGGGGGGGGSWGGVAGAAT